MMLDFDSARRALPAELQGKYIIGGAYPLAAAAYLDGDNNVQGTVTIANINSFQLLGFNGRVWVDGAPETPIEDPSLRINLQMANGAFLTHSAVLWSTLITTPANASEGPNGLTAPVLIAGQEVITVTVTSFAAAGTHYWWELDFVGNDIYNRAPTS